MLDSTANEVRVAEEKCGECPEHEGEDCADTVDGYLIQTFERQAVKAAEVFKPSEDTFDGRPLGIKAIAGGLRHLMSGMGFNDRDCIVTLYDCVISSGAVPSVGQDVGWWCLEKGERRGDLAHVGFVGRGDVRGEGNF